MKYLYYPVLPKDKDVLWDISEQFLRDTWGTDTELIIVVDCFQYAKTYVNRLIYGRAYVTSKVKVFLKYDIDIMQLIKYVDAYIPSDHNDEEIYVRNAYENNKKIIPYNDKIFLDVVISDEWKKEFNIIEKIINDQMITRFSPNEYDYILHQNGLGEGLALFFWLKTYCEIYKKKIILIVIGTTRTELFSKCPYVDAVITVDWLIYEYLAVYKKDIIKHNTLLLHFSKNGKGYRKPDKYFYSDTLFAIEETKEFLGIGKDRSFRKYNVDVENVYFQEAKKYFDKLKLKKGKTVYFIPQGNSFRLLGYHDEFCNNFIKFLCKIGYDVVINGDKEVFSGEKHVMLPLWQSVYFAGLCGNIISVSVGFTQAICALNSNDSINVAVLWPDEKSKYWEENFNFKNEIIDIVRYKGNEFISHINNAILNLEDRIYGSNISNKQYIIDESNSENLFRKIISDFKFH